MEEKLAKIISVVFHPLLLPTYALLLLYSTNFYFVLVLPKQYMYLVLAFVFLATFVLPAIMMLLLLKAGMINSLQMTTSSERVVPLFIVSGFFFATFYFLGDSPQSVMFKLFMLGSTILVLLSLLVNQFTKISIHMVAQGGLFGAFVGLALSFHQDIMYMILTIALVAGLTGFARLRLKAHSPAPVYSGFVLGSVFMLSIFLLS